MSVPSHRSPSIRSFSYSFLKIACFQTSLLRPAISAYHILNDLILPILPLHLQQMITEVKQVKAPLLAQQDNDGAAGPVQAITEALPGVGKGRVRGERPSPKYSYPKETKVSLEEKRNTQRKIQSDSLSLSLLLPTHIWRPEIEAGCHPQLLSQSLSLNLVCQCSQTVPLTGQIASETGQ